MNKFIKFTIKCVIVIAPIILIAIYAKNNLLAFADEEAPYYLWNKQFCNTAQEQQYDVVILGDSVANGSYMPEVLSSSTVNLSLGGATPVENYYMFKDYLDYNEAPKDVFISFMDVHFNDANCFWTRFLYTHRFTIKQNWDILQEAIRFGEKSIATETAYIDLLAYELYFPSKYITSMSNASINQRLEKNLMAYEATDIHNGRYIALGNIEGTIYEIQYTDFYVAPMFDYYYRKIIELCLENGANVHLVKIPLPTASTFTDDYIVQFNDYYQQLQKDYPSITVDWYSESYDDYCYIDSIHMNTHGAFRFSEMIKSEYPDVFDSEPSESQNECLDHDIRGENKLEELFKWIKNDRYSLIIYDNRGDFEMMYDEYLKQDSLIINKFTINGNDSNIYIVGASEYASHFDSIVVSDDCFEIYPGRIIDYPDLYLWNPFDCTGVGVLINNNTDCVVVSERKID